MRNVLAFAREYMKPYMWPLFRSQVIFLLATGVGLLTPLIIRQAIDVGILSNNFNVLMLTALFIFVIGFSRVVLSYIGKIIRFRIASQVMTDMRTRMFGKILKVGPGVKEKFNSGELLARLTTEISVLRQMVNGGILDIANNIIVVATIITISILLDWRLTLLATVPHFFVGILSVTVGYTLLKWIKRVRERFAHMTSMVYESLSSVQIIKTFGREANQTKQIDGLSNRLASGNKIVGIRQSLYMSAYGTMAALSMLLMIWFGAKSVIGGTLTPGTYVALMGYMMILHMPFHSLIGSMYQWYKADIAIKRINDVLHLQEEGSGAGKRKMIVSDIRGRIEVNDVSLSKETRKILEHADATIYPGELTVIVGRSGSGKSLFLQLLAKMIHPDAGSVRLDGYDLREVAIDDLRKYVVYVSQEPWFFQDTLKANIAFSQPNASQAAIENAVDRAGLRKLVDSLPQGLETVIGTRGVTLSGGEKQRIALARALLIQPKVLLLDDPTANIDAEMEHHLLETIEPLRKDHTIVITTQRWSVARRADRLFVVDEGKLVAKGNPGEIQKAPEMWDMMQALLSPSKL